MPRRLVLRLAVALLGLTSGGACTSSAPGGGDVDARGGGVDADAHRAPDGPKKAHPTCPAYVPVVGATCSPPSDEECSFGDPCSFSRFACQGGHWAEIIDDGSVPPTCPEAAPPTGSTCASCGTSYRCVYEASCAATTSICSGGHWLTGGGTPDCGAPDAPGGET